MNIITEFVKEFGEAVEETSDKIIVASSTRIEALVDNDKFFNEYDNNLHNYLKNLPKKEQGKFQTVKINSSYFDIDRIKKILEMFVGSNSFEGKVYRVNKHNFLYIKIDSSYGIIIAEKKKKYVGDSPHEIIYNWHEIFLEQTFSSDMIL